jgi:hypothetical protein
MTDIGPAGIRANILHWDAVAKQRADELQAALDRLNYWLDQISKELNAQSIIQDNNSPG